MSEVKISKGPRVALCRECHGAGIVLKELTRKLRSIMRKRDEARPMAPVVPMNNAKQ